MKDKYIFCSLTRISDLAEKPFSVAPIDRSGWESGDYIACEVSNNSKLRVELCSGRMMEVMDGDILIGALGVRHATLEATGSWKAVGPDLQMNLLTGAGLMGLLTSKSSFIPNLIELQYLGHVFRREIKCTMSQFVPDTKRVPYQTPTILFVGTSMSAGKTTGARIVTRQLKRKGLKVVGAKLTGAGRYRDILTIRDAGADAIYDFVDVGLPSSICSKTKYQEALCKLLDLISNKQMDVAVIEIGASPLEPYNGDTAIKAIYDHIKCIILCASDPYAVLGVTKGFAIRPDIVGGPAVNTIGGIELIHKLTGLKTLNLIQKENLPELRRIIEDSLKR